MESLVSLSEESEASILINDTFRWNLLTPSSRNCINCTSTPPQPTTFPLHSQYGNQPTSQPSDQSTRDEEFRKYYHIYSEVSRDIKWHIDIPYIKSHLAFIFKTDHLYYHGSTPCRIDDQFRVPLNFKSVLDKQVTKKPPNNTHYRENRTLETMTDRYQRTTQGRADSINLHRQTQPSRESPDLD